jgi:hypothetical protein
MMEEIMPVMAGITLGLFISRVPARWRWGAFIVLVVLCGAAASWMSAELAMSWWYLAIDSMQVALGGQLTRVVVERRRRHCGAERDRAAPPRLILSCSNASAIFWRETANSD